MHGKERKTSTATVHDKNSQRARGRLNVLTPPVTFRLQTVSVIFVSTGLLTINKRPLVASQYVCQQCRYTSPAM